MSHGTIVDLQCAFRKNQLSDKIFLIKLANDVSMNIDKARVTVFAGCLPKHSILVESMKNALTVFSRIPNRAPSRIRGRTVLNVKMV